VDSPDDVRASVDDVIAAANRAAEEFGDGPFSSAAFSRLQESIADFIRAVVLEAARTARRQRSDVISRVDVEQASRYIAAGSGRSPVQHVGTVGGILLGAALSNGLNIVSSKSYDASGLIVTGILLVVGTFMIAFHIARDAR
jgi:histone H3/H4